LLSSGKEKIRGRKTSMGGGKRRKGKKKQQVLFPLYVARFPHSAGRNLPYCPERELRGRPLVELYLRRGGGGNKK